MGCHVAIQEKHKAANKHKKLASRDSQIAFKKARSNARHVIREAKEAAGIICDSGKKVSLILSGDS